MYNIIQQIISHSWVSSGDGAQSYIMYACIIVIALLTVYGLDCCRDLIRCFIPHFRVKGGDK